MEQPKSHSYRHQAVTSSACEKTESETWIFGLAKPPTLERVTLRCLEKSPERRFQSAFDLAFAIESAASGSAVNAGRQARSRFAFQRSSWALSLSCRAEAISRRVVALGLR